MSDYLKNQVEENVIEQTGWLEGNEDLEALYFEYKKKYETIKTELTKTIGEPIKHFETDIDFEEFGLIEYTVFKWLEDYYVLGYGQHDRETPIFVSSRKLP